MVFRYLCNLKFFLISLVLVIVFIFIPRIDIYVSNIFFIDSAFIGWSWGIKFFNFLLIKITIILSIVVCLYSIFYSLFIKNKKGSMRYIAYTLAMYTGVHGIIIHVLTKDTFGRPRPLQIIDFGGDLYFTRILEFSHQCLKNCSFASGDVSGSFVFLAFCLAMPISSIVTKKRKFIAIDLAFFLGLLMCFFRLSLGKHFFSDIFCSMFIVICCSFLLYRLIFGKEMYQQLINTLND